MWDSGKVGAKALSVVAAVQGSGQAIQATSTVLILPCPFQAERLYKEADKRYDQVEGMWKIASGPERAVIRQLLRPVTDMLDVLIEK